MWTAACFAVLSPLLRIPQPLLCIPQVRAPSVSVDDAPWRHAGGHPLDGRYKLSWDDTIDGKVEGVEKTCDIEIKVVGEDVIGRFIGPIAGVKREAYIVGHVDGGTEPTSLLTFRQREHGYTCSYQLTLGTGTFLGVWHDTKGRSGDFRMLKNQL